LIENAEDVGRAAICELRPEYEKQFVALMQFLLVTPELRPSARGKLEIGSEEHIYRLAAAYVQARTPNEPKPPSTVPDPLVSFILNVYFSVDEARLEVAKREHQWAMAAENMVGDLLERYLASILEPEGWVWCAGSVIKAVDFVKPQVGGDWVALQVKNRDNSENSSSSAIRNGTKIKTWVRTRARTGKTNWGAFPDAEFRDRLSEQGFHDFVKAYLADLKQQK
jgi:SinI restriction endonuclease